MRKAGFYIIIVILIILIGFFIWLQLFKKEEINDNYLWKKFWDVIEGVEFQHPDQLFTKYIHFLDWPPQVKVLKEPFICAEAGSEIELAGKTEKRMINGHNYCITKISQGVAGSIYTMYAYEIQKDDKVIIFTFSLQSVQCGNYNETQKTECENERESFDIDSIMDRVAQSAKFF